MAAPAVHVITPGDHYSPSTGSAVPTVVHGLASATPPDAPRPRVAVARGTYPDHYPSADVLEFGQVHPRLADRYTDALAARIGLPRRGTRRMLAATLTGQESWPESVVIGHNMPQLVPLIDTSRHVPVLYAHNELLRTYSRREATRVLDPAGAIVCVSRYIAERTAASLPPRLEDRIAVVGNGVDTTHFHPGDRPTGEVMEIAFVGRMLREKGPDVLLDALVRLDRPDIHATFAGTVNFAPGAPLSPYELELRRTAAPLGDRVAWLPFRTRAGVAEILRAADVAVVPSRWPDPCPLTVLEGMASGAAMVAACSGGIPDIVGDAGILVPAGDVEALAEAISALAGDRALLSRSRSAARAHAVAHDWAWARRTLDAQFARLGVAVPSDRAGARP